MQNYLYTFVFTWTEKNLPATISFFSFQNASAWHCFSFSKSPVTLTADGSLLSGGNLTSISVINHVMHSSCGDVSVVTTANMALILTVQQ